MKLILTIALLFCCHACNYAILVPRKNIIYNQRGYIVFYYEEEEALFFPWKDTVDTDFLKKNHLDGYRIRGRENDLRDLSSVAPRDSVLQYRLYNNKTVPEFSKFKIIPVNVKYYWDSNDAFKSRDRNEEQNDIRYSMDNKNVILRYRLYHERIIMAITAIRSNDINRLHLSDVFSH